MLLTLLLYLVRRRMIDDGWIRNRPMRRDALAGAWTAVQACLHSINL